jgi:hypothetical protein
MLPCDQPAQLTFFDHAIELELRRSAADPDARRFPAAGVVVVDSVRDRPLVVGLLSGR